MIRGSKFSGGLPDAYAMGGDRSIAFLLMMLFAWAWRKTVRDFRAGRISVMRAVGLAADRDANPLGYWLLTTVNIMLLVSGTLIAAAWLLRGEL